MHLEIEDNGKIMLSLGKDQGDRVWESKRPRGSNHPGEF